MTTQPRIEEFKQLIPIIAKGEGEKDLILPEKPTSDLNIEIYQVRDRTFDILFDKEQYKILLGILILFGSVPLAWHGYFIPEGLGITLSSGFYNVWKIKKLDQLSQQISSILSLTGREKFSQEELTIECEKILHKK